MRVIEQILQSRDAGRTTCNVVVLVPGSSGMGAIDHVVQAHGFRGLAAEWVEISATEAHVIASTLLHRDLAYGTELVAFARASDLAVQLFDAIPEPHTYFTNGTWTVDDAGSGEAKLRSWNPISDATFDSGVVCLGEGSAALLWVQDED